MQRRGMQRKSITVKKELDQEGKETGIIKRSAAEHRKKMTFKEFQDT